MDFDFSALAARIAAGVSDLKGCLIVSRDGLVLGSHPGSGEAQIRPAWLRVASLGETERGFVQFGDEVWAFARRGPYTAFAVGGPPTRPGVLLDHLEQGLLVAEEWRSRREAVRGPDQAEATRPRLRAPLHREPRPPAQAAPTGGDRDAGRATEAGRAGAGAAHEPSPSPAAPVPDPEPPPVVVTSEPEPAEGDTGAGRTEGRPPAPPAAPVEEEADEVDRVSLAREFSALLKEEALGDEDGV